DKYFMVVDDKDILYECCICMENIYGVEDKYGLCSCKCIRCHKYIHIECLLKWYSVINNICCPLCRNSWGNIDYIDTLNDIIWIMNKLNISIDDIEIKYKLLESDLTFIEYCKV